MNLGGENHGLKSQLFDGNKVKLQVDDETKSGMLKTFFIDKGALRLMWCGGEGLLNDIINWMRMRHNRWLNFEQVERWRNGSPSNHVRQRNENEER